VAKPFVNFEQVSQTGLLNNQSSGASSSSKQIISLDGLGLAADSSHDNRVRKKD